MHPFCASSVRRVLARHRWHAPSQVRVAGVCSWCVAGSMCAGHALFCGHCSTWSLGAVDLAIVATVPPGLPMHLLNLPRTLSDETCSPLTLPRTSYLPMLAPIIHACPQTCWAGPSSESAWAGCATRRKSGATAAHTSAPCRVRCGPGLMCVVCRHATSLRIAGLG